MRSTENHSQFFQPIDFTQQRLLCQRRERLFLFGKLGLWPFSPLRKTAPRDDARTEISAGAH
jgi:hypothetical protein